MKTLSYEFSRQKIFSQIIIDRHLFSKDEFFEILKKMQSRFCIVTDSTVEKIHGLALLKKLTEKNIAAKLFSSKPGECFKSRKTKDALEDFLLTNHFTKQSCLIALGGGSVSDLTGYVASTFLRSIPYLTIPTTLLGAVDAAIGGKTAIDTPFGKNLIGSFHHPSTVFIDPNFILKSPLQELKNGFAEVFKYALVFDLDLFNKLCSFDHISKISSHHLESIIEKSLRVKTSVIEQDPYDKGLRKLLNFGHTFGHALETASNHLLAHGQAVYLGMLAECYLSVRLGHLPSQQFFCIQKILKDLKLIPSIEETLSKRCLKNALLRDKKNMGHKIGIVILKSIGQPPFSPYVQLFSLEDLSECIDWLFDKFQVGANFEQLTSKKI